jgi:predicted O-methyltransferase YrrM
MKDDNIQDIPTIHPQIEAKSKEIGFTMPSDLYIGTLLKTLMSSKPNGRFLELGTGIGLSLSWMIDGLQGKAAHLTSVDNDPELISIAEDFFNQNDQVSLVCQGGTEWIKAYTGAPFDLVFADAWPGKYSETDEILKLIKHGGFYIIDDMTAQPNWPEGHTDNVDWLVAYLEKREDFILTKMNWSTGVIVAAKIG